MTPSDWNYLIDELPMTPHLQVVNSSFIAAENQLPFSQIWEHLSRRAWADISRATEFECLSESAAESLIFSLVERMSCICSVPLWEYFQKTRLVRFPYLAIADREHEVEAYQWFTTFLFQGGLKTFFNNHQIPWLRISILLTSWANSTLKFLLDFHHDIDVLINSFNINGNAKIRNLTIGLSDPHNGGRSVIAVEIDDVSHIDFLYKPKNIGPENLFRKILSSLCDFNIPWCFRDVISLDCGDHGWVESIPFKSVTNECDIEDYYKKVGVVLCLAYILKLTDLHAENIVAHGDTPYILDMEAMFHPLFMRENSTFTVLDTGLIPPILSSHVDIYGLTAIGGEASGMLHCKWENVGENGVHPTFITGNFGKCNNLPVLDNMQISASQYIEFICEGFNVTYDALHNDQPRLINLVKDALETSSFETRIIPRSTMQYSVILRNLVIYNNQDEVSSKNYIHQALNEDTHNSKIMLSEFRQAEVEALERLDIPCFRVKINDNEIIEHAKRITSTIMKDAVGTILHELTKTSDIDKETQLKLIKYSLSQLGGGELVR